MIPSSILCDRRRSYTIRGSLCTHRPDAQFQRRNCVPADALIHNSREELCTSPTSARTIPARNCVSTDALIHNSWLELCTHQPGARFQRGIVYLTNQRTHNSSEELCIHRRAHTQFQTGIVYPPTDACTIPSTNQVSPNERRNYTAAQPPSQPQPYTATRAPGSHPLVLLYITSVLNKAGDS